MCIEPRFFCTISATILIYYSLRVERLFSRPIYSLSTQRIQLEIFGNISHWREMKMVWRVNNCFLFFVGGRGGIRETKIKKIHKGRLALHFSPRLAIHDTMHCTGQKILRMNTYIHVFVYNVFQLDINMTFQFWNGRFRTSAIGLVPLHASWSEVERSLD